MVIITELSKDYTFSYCRLNTVAVTNEGRSTEILTRSDAVRYSEM